jgi:hypothetical protein
MWRVSDRWQFGAEVFGEPEARAHYLGPRVALGLGNTSLSVAYLAGLDEARADGQFRLALELTP